MRISQQIRPEGVFTPSPVTLVGALVLGRTSTALFAGAVWARTNTPVNARMIATATRYFVILNSLRNHVKHSGHRRIWSISHSCYPAVEIFYSSAITSISTKTSFGSRATSTVERAGGAELKYLP